MNPSFASPSTFTLRGQLTDGTQHLRISSITVEGVVTATSGVVAGGSTFTWVNVNVYGIRTSSLTAYGNISSSSTFIGGGFNGGSSTFTRLNVNGNVFVSSVTSYGGFISTSLIVGGNAVFTQRVGIGVSSATALLDVVNGSITVRGTNPGISVIGGSITATGFMGYGSALLDLQASQIDGNLAVANLNSGTDASAGTFWRGDGVWAGLPGTPAGTSSSTIKYDLIITTNGTNTNDIVVKAKALGIMGNYHTTVSTVCSLNKAGAGGLDTGSEAKSTWYALFAISNGSTMSVVASSAPNIPPTLPSGYSEWRRIGFIYNDSSSNIVPTFKRGHVTSFWTPQVILDEDSVTDTEILSYETFVPPSVIRIMINVDMTPAAGGASLGVQLRSDGDPGVTGSNFISWNNSAGVTVAEYWIDTVLNVFEGRRKLIYASNINLGVLHLVLKSYEEED